MHPARLRGSLPKRQASFHCGASGLLAPNFHYTIPPPFLSRVFAKKNKKIFFPKRY